MSVPVLMYHHILSRDSFIASSVTSFEKQMKYLADNSWKSLTSEEFFLYKKKQLQLPEKSVLITFDDGWRDNFIYAYPILKKYNLKATLFVVTGWIEEASKAEECDYVEKNHKECKALAPINPRAVLCNWDELKKMKDVFDIHCHTHTHRDDYFGKLTLQEDIQKAKQSIKDNMGFEDHFLCWPRGIYDENSIKEALNQNFDILFTTKRGINKADNNLLEIKRLAVKKDAKWLKKNLTIFSNPILGYLYAKVKPQ
jgi:peptidoglycan/xylan/chitin deacetylase (PgdA/CDA1 family)